MACNRKYDAIDKFVFVVMLTIVFEGSDLLAKNFETNFSQEWKVRNHSVEEREISFIEEIFREINTSNIFCKDVAFTKFLCEREFP